MPGAAEAPGLPLEPFTATDEFAYFDVLGRRDSLDSEDSWIIDVDS